MDDFTFSVVASAVVGYEIIAVVTPLPTISTLVRGRPVPVRVAIVAAFAALLADHFIVNALP